MSRKNIIRFRNKRGFVELISINFLLSVSIVLLFYTLYVNLPYVTGYFAIERAAKIAAELTSEPELVEKNPGVGNTPKSYIKQFNAQEGSTAHYAVVKETSLCNEHGLFYDDEELHGNNDAATLACVTDLWTRRQVIARPGFSGDLYFLPGTNSVKNFPFRFTDSDASVPAFDKTQRYPFVNLKRSCAESYNETDATIGSECALEKAQTYIAPGMIDWDGDGREDPTMFQPVGSVLPSEAGAFNADVAEYDIVAFLSSMGFAAPSGIRMFNLSAAPRDGEPQDQLIAIDVDQDGQTDPAVFSPTTGEYRFFSSLANRLQVFSGEMGISDPTGELGLVAFGGSFTGPGSADIVVVQTAGPAADRYRIFLAAALQDGFKVENGEWSFSEPEVETITDISRRPIKGAAAYLAFADINGDGVSEGGYTSVYTGMPVKHVAGAVDTDDGATPTIPTAFSGTTAKAARLNPKDLAFDSGGYMYILDPVAGMIHRTDAPAGSDGELGSITTLNQGPASEQTPAIGDAGNYWPFENVVNLPSKSCEESAPNESRLGNVPLCNPRSIAVAKCENCNNELVIADTGHGVLYVAAPDSGGITPSTTTYRLIDSDVWSDLGITTTFFPLAVLAVPNPRVDGSYDILVANDYSLYLIRKTEDLEAPGPRPKFFTVTRVAGSGVNPFATANYSITATGLTGASTAIADLRAAATRLCPIVSLAKDTLSDSVYAGLSCGTAIFDGDPNWMDSGVTRNVGGIIKISSDDSDFVVSTKGDIVLGSFRSRPCSIVSGLSQQCGVPIRQEGTDYGLFKRKINLSETDPREIAAMNIVGLAVGSKGEVYFVDQWNEIKDQSETYYKNDSAFARPDRLHAQGIYRLFQTGSDTVHLEAISNPIFFGENSIPVDHRKWLSPIWAGTEYLNYIEPFEAPASQVPFPAGAGIAINPGNDYIFAATMWLKNAETDSSSTFFVDPMNVGFIFGAKLDTDGDGVLDANDGDVDGDGAPDEDETGERSPFCPEIWGPDSTKGCRYAEAARMPRQYYFNVAGGDIDMPADMDGGSALSNAATIEYLFFNSVSAYDTGGKGAKPEPWALLFSSGHGCTTNITDVKSPYYNCEATRNGPIPSAVPLHAFVGVPDTSLGGDFNRASPATKSSLEIIDQARPTKRVDRGNVAFPVVFDSTNPWERGIKPTRRPMATGGSKDWVGAGTTREIRSSGALCFDGKIVEYEQSSAPITPAPFRLNTSNYLTSNLVSGVTEDEDGGSLAPADNDNLNYIPDCSATTGNPDYRLGDSTTKKIYTEGVVLQLDHDYTNKKTTPSMAIDDQPAHWMPSYFSDRVTSETPENVKSFTLLDLDGNGSRDYGLYATNVPYGNDWATGSRSFTLVVAGLKDDSYKFADEIRAPLSMTGFGFDSYPGAWFSVHSTPWYRFVNNGEDWKLTMFDKSRSESSYGESFAISLDNQVYLSRGLKIDSYKPGAPSNYANYIRNNRFVVTPDGDEPPGLLAAKRFLMRFYFFKEDQFVTSLEESVFTKGKVFVGFLKNDEICSVWSDSLNGEYGTVGYCDEVYIAYKMDVSGDTPPVITGNYPIHNIDIVKERCDPLELGGSAFPCTEEEA